MSAWLCYGYVVHTSRALQGFEGVHTCLLEESLYTIMKRIVDAKVRAAGLWNDYIHGGR